MLWILLLLSEHTTYLTSKQQTKATLDSVQANCHEYKKAKRLNEHKV